MNKSATASVAQKIFDEHVAKKTWNTYTEGAAPDIAAAYETQLAYVDLLVGSGHGEIVGHKIALTTAAMQEMVGVDHPLAGYLLASKMHRSPYTVALSGHQHIGVEFEVAVEIGATPAAHQIQTRQTIQDVVSAVMPAFEIVEDRNADYAALEAFSLIAENSWNAGNVLGERITDWHRIDLETATTSLDVNGENEGQAKTGDAMGHPFDVVAWIANLLAERGETLQAGQVIMTGSSLKTRFPEAGDHYHFTIEGLGSVDLNVTR